MENFLISLLILLISFFSLTLSILFYKHKSQFSYPNIPPGGIGYPLIGETLNFLFTGWKGEPEKFVFDRITKYKSEIFKTSIVGVPAAVFCGPVCNKFLFSNEDKLVTPWWPDSVNKIFPSSTQTNSKEEAKKLKKLLPQFLSPEALHRYIGIMDTVAQKHFASSWENKEEILVHPLAKKFTFTLACRLFVSVENEMHVEKWSVPFNQISSGVISIPINIPGTAFNRSIKASNFMRTELLGIVKQRKMDLMEGKASKNQDILSHMLLTCDQNGQFLNEYDIADKILGLLIGGHGTTSSACTFIVNYLSNHPHIYHEVYKEQMEIAKSKAVGELLNWEDIQKMKYSWNVACEVLRLAPPLQGAFREAINDFVFNGFHIPKGWKLYWSSNSTHKNPDYFPDPYKFDPTRFEGNGPAPYTFVPFGGGPRMCPGKEYARFEILVFIHHLVKRFKWSKLLQDEKIIFDPMPMPQQGLPLRLYPHKISV